MKPILLRKTWREIAEYLDEGPHVTRIVETVNRLAPRPWTFRFAFSRAGTTDLLIDGQPPLSVTEAALVLDGFLDELFLTDTSLVHAPDGTYSIDTGAILLNPPHHNDLTPRKTAPPSSLTGLQLVGFGRTKQLPSSLHLIDDLAEVSTLRTWLGAYRFAQRSGLTVDWNMYGHVTRLVPAPRSSTLLGPHDTFTRHLDLFAPDGEHLGSALAGTSPRLSATTVWTDIGQIDRRLLLPNSRFMQRSPTPPWFVEIGTSQLGSHYWDTPGRNRLIKCTVAAVDTALAELEHHDTYLAYADTMHRKDKRRAAQALARRQRRAAAARSVAYNGQPLQTEPSCENEVLVLLSKLEVLGAIPFHQFQLVEYTAQKGIDALARIMHEEPILGETQEPPCGTNVVLTTF